MVRQRIMVHLTTSTRWKKLAPTLKITKYTSMWYFKRILLGRREISLLTERFRRTIFLMMERRRKVMFPMTNMWWRLEKRWLRLTSQRTKS